LSGSIPILALFFVNPAFLIAGALLAAIPIIIHWLNRRRYKLVNWAAMEFLLRAMKQNRRRLRFESWLLLAVRCLVLALLGAALARPLGCQDTSLASLAGRRSGLHVIVIDNSYPMGYEADRPDAKTDLDQAKKLADGIIDRLSAGGESVAIITTARPAKLITPSPLYDLHAAKSAVDRVEQSFSDSDLTGALTAAAEVAQAETSQPNKELDLIDNSTRSVWQSTGEIAGAQPLAPLGRDLAGRYRIVHFDLSRPGQSNGAVTDLRSGNGLTRLGFPSDFSATVRGFGDSPDTLVQWKLDDQTLPNAKTIHPEPDSQPIALSDAPFRVGGPHVISVSAATKDRLSADDTRWHTVDVASELKVLIVEGERGTGPLDGSGAFLQLALAPPAENNVGGTLHSSSYITTELASDLELSGKILPNYSAVALAGVGQISPQEAEQLKAFVQQGGSLLIFMGEAVSGDSYNQSLLPPGLLPGPLTKRIGDAGGQKSYLFDFKSNGNLDPLLHAFTGLDNTGLDTAAGYSYWQIDLPAGSKARRVLNYLPDEKGHADPAITEHALGAGKVVFISTSANAEWTSLPVKPAYITLMHELVAGTVSSGDGWMNLGVGQSLELPASIPITNAPTLKDPQQQDILLQPPSGSVATYHSQPLVRPGVYTLSTGVRTYPISVNVPSDAADIRAVDGTAIRHALGDVEVDLEADQLPPVQASEIAGNDFGWSVMTIVLALLATESLLAKRFGHDQKK
jgi:hypothetical protein